jgi:serine/threonine protein phosphatase PrpC
MLDVEFAELSHPGRFRDSNEDYLDHVTPATPEEAQSHGWLFTLADGVGGHQHGEVASRIAVEHVVTGFRDARHVDSHKTLLARLVQTANAAVYQAGSRAGQGTRMATTLVACALRFDRVVVAHVGDSRCYLIRRGQTSALTRDHTLPAEQARLGILTARDASQSLAGNMLTRSIGNDLIVAVETSEHLVFAGDILMLCSDGLHGAIAEDELAGIVTGHNDLKEAADALIALANERDGSDNVSVQLIRVLSVERVGIYRGRSYKL